MDATHLDTIYFGTIVVDFGSYLYIIFCNGIGVVSFALIAKPLA